MDQGSYDARMREIQILIGEQNLREQTARADTARADADMTMLRLEYMKKYLAKDHESFASAFGFGKVS